MLGFGPQYCLGVHLAESALAPLDVVPSTPAAVESDRTFEPTAIINRPTNIPIDSWRQSVTRAADDNEVSTRDATRLPLGRHIPVR